MPGLRFFAIKGLLLASLFAAAPALTAEKYKIEDYRSLWGISGKTTRAEVIARFGQPPRIIGTPSGPAGAHPATYYYFNDTLSFYFSKTDTVNIMTIGTSFNPIPPNVYPPEIIERAFIGKHRDEVLKAFGPADEVSSDNYRYNPKSRAFFKVEFQCYSFDKFICQQVTVQF